MDNKEATFDNDIEKGVTNNNTEAISSTGVVDNCNVMEDVKKPKVMSAKKPPRPPRGLSLDSADHKLIRELHELAKLKRARVERMKALKKSKDAKIIGSSWKNHLFWTFLTLLFCFALFFQGISSRTNTGAKFQGSPVSSEAVRDNGISLQHFPNSLASHVNEPGSEFPRHVEPVSGSESNARGQGNAATG